MIIDEIIVPDRLIDRDKSDKKLIHNKNHKKIRWYVACNLFSKSNIFINFITTI
jgi:hypothetical protein